MVQKTGELKAGLEGARKFEKLKFNKPKTEGITLSPEKQKQLNNGLVDALNKGNKDEEIERLLKAGADMSAIKQTTKEFYNEDIDKALEDCQKEGFRAMSMPELIDARINGKANWDKLYFTPSIIATGKTNEGKAVAVIAHVPNYFSNPANIRKAKKEGLINGAGRMPQEEFQKLVDAKDGKNVFVINYNELKNSKLDRISITEALEHPEVIPFLGGKERAEKYLAKFKEAYNKNSIGVWHEEDLSEKGPVGRLLFAGDLDYYGLLGINYLYYNGRFLGVRFEIAEGEAKKTKAPSIDQIMEIAENYVPTAAKAEFEEKIRELYK